MKIKSQGLFFKMDEFQFVPDSIKGKISLGVGSFGEVKLAKNKKDQGLYAIKIMNLSTLNSQTELQGIEREINVQSSLSHPHIIKLYDSFVENNNVNMILEYAKNGNLYSYLYKKRKFDENEAFKYFYQTCLAIQYLHQNNIVHRDIKPENLLLDDDFNIKLCDFGWCTKEINDQRMTFCGTYEYMAPEIVFSKPYDYRIDIWALGILLYELVHGYAPFKGKTFAEIQRKIKKGDVSFSEKVSHDVKQLIAEILQSNPKKRIEIGDILKNQWVKNMIIRNSNILQIKNTSVNSCQELGEIQKENIIQTTFISCSGNIQQQQNKQAIKPCINFYAEADQIVDSNSNRQQLRQNNVENNQKIQTQAINTQQQSLDINTINYINNSNNLQQQQQQQKNVLKSQKNLQIETKTQGQLSIYQQLLLKQQPQINHQQQQTDIVPKQITPKSLVYRANQFQPQSQKLDIQIDDQIQQSKTNISEFTNFQSFNVQQQSQQYINDYKVDPVTNLIKLDSSSVSAIKTDYNNKLTDSTHNSFIGCNLSLFDEQPKQLNQQNQSQCQIQQQPTCLNQTQSQTNNNSLCYNNNNKNNNSSITNNYSNIMHKASKSQDIKLLINNQLITVDRSRNDEKLSPNYNQNQKKTHRIFDNYVIEQNQQNLTILQDNINLCNQTLAQNQGKNINNNSNNPKDEFPKSCNRRVTTDIDLPLLSALQEQAQFFNSKQNIQNNLNNNKNQNLKQLTNNNISNVNNNNISRQNRSKTLIFSDDNLDRTKLQIEVVGKLITALEENKKKYQFISNNNDDNQKNNQNQQQQQQKNQFNQSQQMKIIQKENFPPKNQREKNKKIFDNNKVPNDNITKIY